MCIAERYLPRVSKLVACAEARRQVKVVRRCAEREIIIADTLVGGLAVTAKETIIGG